MITKSLLAAFGVLTFVGLTTTPAFAGDRTIDVGFGRGRIIITSHHDRDHDRDRDFRRPGRFRPAPRHHHHGTWIPGHYETRLTRVWVPGTIRQEYVPPVYEDRCDYYGRHYRVLVREGYVRYIEIPGRYETREERIWIPGRWSCCH